MKKFRFPLRSVSTLRTMRELRAREQFSSAVQVYVAAEERLQTIRAKLADLEQVLRAGRAHRFRPSDEVSFIQALQAETITAKKADAEVVAARTALASARQAWLESRRDLKVLDNLEQKARNLHRLEVERDDQAAMDDRTNALAARAASRRA